MGYMIRTDFTNELMRSVLNAPVGARAYFPRTRASLIAEMRRDSGPTRSKV